MDIDFGDADAGVGIAISVLSDYLAELQRIGQLPQQVTFQRVFNGQDVDVLVLIDPPVFELIQVPNAEPYTRVYLTGSIEVRPAGQPDASPIVLGLNAGARLSLVLVGQRAVGLQYDGVDGQPLAPVTEADIDNLFTSPEVAAALEKTIDLATPLIAGLNQSRFPDARSRPDDSAWAVKLTLMPGGEDSVRRIRGDRRATGDNREAIVDGELRSAEHWTCSGIQPGVPGSATQQRRGRRDWADGQRRQCGVPYLADERHSHLDPAWPRCAPNRHAADRRDTRC